MLVYSKTSESIRHCSGHGQAAAVTWLASFLRSDPAMRSLYLSHRGLHLPVELEGQCLRDRLSLLLRYQQWTSAGLSCPALLTQGSIESISVQGQSAKAGEQVVLPTAMPSEAAAPSQYLMQHLLSSEWMFGEQLPAEAAGRSQSFIPRRADDSPSFVPWAPEVEKPGGTLTWSWVSVGIKGIHIPRCPHSIPNTRLPASKHAVFLIVRHVKRQSGSAASWTLTAEGFDLPCSTESLQTACGGCDVHSTEVFLHPSQWPTKYKAYELYIPEHVVPWLAEGDKLAVLTNQVSPLSSPEASPLHAIHLRPWSWYPQARNADFVATRPNDAAGRVLQQTLQQLSVPPLPLAADAFLATHSLTVSVSELQYIPWQAQAILKASLFRPVVTRGYNEFGFCRGK